MKKKLFFGALGAVAVCAAVCFYFVFTGRQDKMSLSYLGRMNVEALVSGESAGSVSAVVCNKSTGKFGPYVGAVYCMFCGENTPTKIVTCMGKYYGIPGAQDRCLPE